MFAKSARRPPIADGTADQPRGVAPRSFPIHSSAIIACACYVIGAALDVFTTPQFIQDLVDRSTGDYVQVIAVIVFLCVVAAIQRHMGISLRTSRTATPEQLCTSGPFKYTRNPIYLAFLIPLAALGYFSALGAAVAILLYLFATTEFVIRDEERALRSKFGATFEAYRAQTPRWLLI